jgi:hypothetical protein
MNDVFREFKARLRKLDGLLVEHGVRDMAFAQAVSRVHRAERHGDRSREPSDELRTLLENAEALASKQARDRSGSIA